MKEFIKNKHTVNHHHHHHRKSGCTTARKLKAKIGKLEDLATEEGLDPAGIIGTWSDGKSQWDTIPGDGTDQVRGGGVAPQLKESIESAGENSGYTGPCSRTCMDANPKLQVYTYSGRSPDQETLL